jgi:integrase
MALAARYERAKRKLVSDDDICPENRELFEQFLSYEEYKLKRMRGSPALDDNSYRTLLAYTTRLRVVNAWFRNKPWCQLSRADIQDVYDRLEDGKITTRFGAPLKDKRTYYKLIIRGKPFEMAGKKTLVNEVMQFPVPQASEEVRFIPEPDFRRLVEAMSKLEHRAFLWLCWDIGENASSILKLTKADCTRQVNEVTKEPEYLINLRREILKRSRKARSEITNYAEAVYYLDILLKQLNHSDLLFDFQPAWGKKVLRRAVQKTGVCCRPAGQIVTLKDLRSSMACDLLSKGWSRDEVNARLGHSPSSKEIDRYVNYLAIDRTRPKRKLHEHQIDKVMFALEQIQAREKRMAAQLHMVQQSSKAQLAHMKRVSGINAQIAALAIEHQLGRSNQTVYRQQLMQRYHELLSTIERMDDPATLTSSVTET